MKKRYTHLVFHRLLGWLMIIGLIQQTVDVPALPSAFAVEEPVPVLSIHQGEQVRERPTKMRLPVYVPVPDSHDSEEELNLSTGEDDFFPQTFVLVLPRFQGWPVASPAAFRVGFFERIFRDVSAPPPRRIA